MKKKQHHNESSDDTLALSHARDRFSDIRKKHWNNLAEKTANPFFSRQYQNLLKRIYKSIIPEGSRILDIGCNQGDLLNSLKPSYGLGIDFSETCIDKAKHKYPNLEFTICDAHNIANITANFDYIILSDVINELFDIQETLSQINKICKPRTRVVVNFFNYFWYMPIHIGRVLGLARPMLLQNWVSGNDFKNLLKLTGYDVISDWGEILIPINTHLIDLTFNRFMAKLWPLNHITLSSFFVFRKELEVNDRSADPSVSIIVAARNEAGHIEEILKRVPKIGSQTELIFVEGGSDDNTYQVISDSINEYSRIPTRLYKQKNKGKGDAVRLGFDKAENDVLMILDADLTVMPEDLPKFYEALMFGRGEFINGVRLVYPMEKRAMRLLNYVGNKFFSVGFSYVLNQPIKDTLCGTKVIYKEDYLKIAKHRSYFGDFDPYGDFDLIFGAAKQHLKIIDMPVRYQARTYGDTNINRWEGGWLLLKMLFIALKKLKFI